MATRTIYEISDSEEKPSAGRRALVVVEVALAIIITTALFNTVERNLIPISAQAAAPGAMPSAQKVMPGRGVIDSATAAVFPSETWYTPAQHQNQATDIEALPSQF